MKHESLNGSTAGAACGFRNVVVVHIPGQPWSDLADFADVLAPGAGGRLDAVVAAPPSGLLEAALEAAFEHQVDLLVLRHPRALGQSRGFARRLLRTAPCSVCFVPAQPPSRTERIVAGIELDGAGRALLLKAAEISRAVCAEELAAVHCCFLETKAEDESFVEHTRFARTTDVFRFVSGAELDGVACTPVLQEGPVVHMALAEAAAGRGADLVVVGHEPGGRADIISELLWNCASPVVQVLLPDPRNAGLARRVGRNLRKIFSNPEPAFN